MLTNCEENLFLGPLSRLASPQACSVSPRSGACPLSSQCLVSSTESGAGHTRGGRQITRVGVRRDAPALLEGSKRSTCEALKEGRLRQALALSPWGLGTGQGLGSGKCARRRVSGAVETGVVMRLAYTRRD